MSDVVKQSGDADHRLMLVADVITDAELCDHSGRQMKSSQTVRKTRMFCRLIGKVRQSKLSNPPKSLKLRRVYQRHDEAPLRATRVDANNVVD